MTPKQNACLIALRDLTVDGVSPSYDELQQHLGLASKSGVFRLIDALERQGLVRRHHRQYRAIEIIHQPGLSDSQIAGMDEPTLYGLMDRIEASLEARRLVSGLMREMAA